MANAGGFSEERIVTPVGAGEVRKGGGDACVALRPPPNNGRRKRLHPTQPHSRPYGTNTLLKLVEKISECLMYSSAQGAVFSTRSPACWCPLSNSRLAQG